MKLTTLYLISSQALVAYSGPVVKRQSTENTTLTGTSDDASATSANLGDPVAAGPFVYNLRNKTCGDTEGLAAHDLWGLVDGDETIRRLEAMLTQNLLYCDDCHGNTKGDCASSNRTCSLGLADKTNSSLDAAVGIFNGLNSLQCGIGENLCGAPKFCENAEGPGAWVLAQSLSTLDNLFNNIFNAIESAGQSANSQMTVFREAFAPVPEVEDNSFALSLFSAITSGIVGFIPGAGAAVGGLLVGVGNAVLAEVLKQETPPPTETASTLGLMVKAIQEIYQSFTTSLFKYGSFSYTSADSAEEVTVSLADLMKNGSSLNPGAEALLSFTNQRSKYETILFQQLAVYTWTNLQSDSKGHVPFIGFDSMPCSQVNTTKDQTAAYKTLGGAKALEASYEHNGVCYYLLDGTTFGDDSNSCVAKILPGGTTKNLTLHHSNFQLEIEDFIIPSVDGWLAHDRDNTYYKRITENKLVKGPRAPGAVHLPICDYLGNPENPGVYCPKFGDSDGNKCHTYAPKTQANPPGVSNPGWCQLHVSQFQRNLGDVNPTDRYQLEVSVFDNLERKVGFASKQAAFAPLEVQGSLPHNLIVAPGSSDDEPISFWYSDQFWTSDDQSHMCSTGRYDNGIRQMDCGFQCPPQRENPPVSATEGHVLPAAPTPAVVGPSSFLNTFTTVQPTAAPTPEPVPTYARGWCTFHMTQWQKNERGLNESPDYAIEMTIKDAEGRVIGSSGKIQTPDGQDTLVRGGLEHYLVITPGGVDADPFAMRYGNSAWSTDNEGHCSPYHLQVYDGGKRELDCGFTC